MKQAQFHSAAGVRLSFLTILLILIGTLLLNGCGAPAAPQPAATSAATAASTAAPGSNQQPPAIQPKRGGSLVLRAFTGGDIPDLDPYLNGNFRSAISSSFFYSRLLKYDSGPNVGANSYLPKADLAESWDVSKDGLTYTFHLRKNAKWHNKPPLNGRAVTADDVVYSWGRYTTVTLPTTKGAAWVVNTKEVKATDPNTVVFTLKDAYAPFETTLAGSSFYIMPKEVIDADGNASKRVIGSGPFMFDKYDKSVQIVGKRNPDYYITGQPYVDEVVLLVIPEDTTAVAGLRGKSIDYNVLNNQTDRKALASSNPEIRLTDYAFNLLPIFYWKIDKPPFSDIRVRQAVSLALDRDEAINVIFEGQGVYNNFIAAALESWWLDPRGPDMGPNAKYFKRDVATAKKLLADAGYPNGLKIPFITSLNAYGATFNNSVELFIKQLKDAGIDADLKPQDYSAFFTTTSLGKFDSGTMVYGLLAQAEPHNYLYPYYHPQGASNLAGVNDPVLTDMIEKQLRATDRVERKKIIFDIQRYLAEKQYYVVSSIGNQTAATQPWVKNYYPANTFGFGAEWVVNVWLDGKSSN